MSHFSAFSQVSRGDKALLQYTAGNSEAAAKSKSTLIAQSIPVSLLYLQFRVPFSLNSTIIARMSQAQ